MFVQSAADRRCESTLSISQRVCYNNGNEKQGGQSVPREGKDMSNFNDLYDHVATDRTRAIQLLGIQDIRRKAIAELLAANAYTEPANIDAMTEQEREQHKAEAAYALGRPHILEVAQVPAPNSDETYAMAVGATS